MFCATTTTAAAAAATEDSSSGDRNRWKVIIAPISPRTCRQRRRTGIKFHMRTRKERAWEETDGGREKQQQQQQQRRRRMEVSNFITTGTRVSGTIVLLMLSGTVMLEGFVQIAMTRLSETMVTGYSCDSQTCWSQRSLQSAYSDHQILWFVPGPTT